MHVSKTFVALFSTQMCKKKIFKKFWKLESVDNEANLISGHELLSENNFFRHTLPK